MKAAFSSALTRPRPSDTHFSKSSTPGGESPLARDDDNTLVTHAVLFDGTKTALVILGTGVALGAAATVKVAPHIKSGLTSLKSKLRRRAEDTTDAETLVPLTVVAEIEPEQQDPLDCALSDRQARRRRGFG